MNELFNNYSYNPDDYESYDDYLNDLEIISYDFFNNLNRYLKNNPCVVTGMVKRWNGRTYGTDIVCNTNDLFDGVLSDCDYLVFEEKDGHVYITGIHHDGNVHLELKKLTTYGINKWLESSWLSSVMLNTNFMSKKIGNECLEW